MPDPKRGARLAIETSTRRASVALEANGSSRVKVLERERAHASDLLPSIQSLLEDAGIGPKDLAAIVVGTGPGSFTGLRVGIATALGLAHATRTALIGIPSFEALAHAHLQPGQAGVVLRDARAGRIYVARYGRDTQDVEVLAAPAALEPALARRVIATNDHILCDASSAELLSLGVEAATPMTLDADPTADHLLSLSHLRKDTGEPVRPLYLMPFGQRAGSHEKRATPDPSARAAEAKP